MKPIQKFLSEIAVLDIKLFMEGNILRCNAPQGIVTPEIRSQLSNRKAEIIKFLQSHYLQVIPKSSKNYEKLPLSFAQERLWFLNQLEGSSATYNMPVAVSISGNLDIKALQEALSEIVRRHEVLRTSFPTVNGTPIQVIHPEATMNIKVVDLQQLAATARETVLQQQVQQEAITPFDLKIAPLIRCSLLQLEAREYVLLLNMHHIVSDGWSIGVFISELSTLYRAFSTGVPSPLPELPIQYADFAVWQREWLSGEGLLSQINYWLSQLEGTPELLELPTDRTRPSVQSYRGATQSWSLNSDLTQKLETLSRNSGTTLFMTLQAAFSTLLYRYSGQSDILVGTPIAYRNRREIESLIGFFVNTLVLRNRFEDHLSFEQLLTQVRETTLEAYEHQDVPFEQVVEALQTQRSLSHSPLFQVMFVLQNAPMGELELPGVTLSELNQERTIAKFDLTLSMTETDQGLLGSWEYNTDLFDGSTIERMAAHFENLLSAIVENPQQKVSELPLLSAAERHQLLVEWNDTATEYPSDKCIHQLFESQVEKTPDAVAVVFENQQLTYQQLNHRANQLAHHLLSLGVQPEVLVGICVERSIEMVVGILGILKAGGAYVPLDPNYPQERLSYMLADSGVEVLLIQQSLLESLPLQTARVVCLDSNWGVIEQHSQENLDVGVCSDNLAYVIYTSGSTGKPKGAMNTHQGIRNRLLWMQNAYQLTNSDRVLQKTPFSFDVSVWEFFWPLLTGARILVAQPEGHKDSNYLVNLIAQQQITTIHFVPSMLQVFLQAPNLENCSCLKRVFCSGEALPFELTQYFFSKLECELHNLYGPTEAAIDVTFWQCQPQKNLQIVPIGRPISNTQIYLLDQHLQPVPIGVAGELYIGGDGLARGYLNRPELTSEKFIPNPFDPKSKIYKTGDLARYLSDGNIEYIGRIDQQVKIRGFRIELGEIEAVLNSHAQIQQTVVIATEDLTGNKRLVAYVVSEDESLSTHQLREFLKSKLPEYMVPSAFVTLDTLPLTPNGKVDRKALPAPDGEISREQEYVAPRTAIEQVLTNIWQELLQKEQVSIHDNFFEIGGDSILSIQMVSRAKNSGVQITAKQIFQNQTIAELAKVANTTVSVTAQQGIVTGVAPLTPIQQWFFAQNRQEAHHYNQSVLLQIPNHLQTELIETAWKKLLEHHDALRLRFRSVASEHQQINQGFDDTVAFTVVDLSSTPVLEQPQNLLQIATEFQASLNLSDGPLMQVVMFNLGSYRDARLLIIIHHLAVDGVSWRILLSDLETIYQQLITTQPIKLSPKTTAFIDWAEKLNNYAQTEIIKQELDYWLNQPWSKTTPLPLDYADKSQENTVGSTAVVSVKLSIEETQALLGSVNEAYNTQINDILLSALVVSLTQWTGNSTVRIDLEGHGREELFSDVDLSRTVGWFTSLFPVLLQLPAINQPASVIKSIKEQLRAIPNRGIGYGILRYLCEDPIVTQKLQTISPPEICFNYLGQFDQVQSQTGWKFAPESTGANQSLKQTRDHLLEINSLVVEGEFQINWTYSRNIHSSATVDNLAQSYLQAIRSIIEHCQLEDAFGYTPSDFPDAQLNQLELDDLLAPLKTQNISSIYPLSPMQQGMLFHSLYAPESGVYFEQMTLNFKGNVNVATFESTWQKVVDRHSILRTFFVWENRQTPLQVVLKRVNLPWDNLDWRGLSPTEQQQQLSELLQTQRRLGFQFNQAPLMRCALIKLSEDTYKFIWSHHHILMDGWCLPIILREVLSFYEAELRGETCQLPTPSPYRDYIAWLNDQDQETAIEFWQQTLQGFSAPTPLVVDKTQYQNQQQDSDYKELELRLSAQVSRQLQSVAQESHVTLSTIVQAAWGLLLSRYSGEQDVVFGVTVSGRTGSLSGVENLVGLLINTLPLRLQISPDQQLIPWLEQIQQLMWELQHYSYTPLVDIQARSEVPGGIPLFESILVFENYPVESSLLNQGGSLQLGEIEGFEQTNYPLTVVAVPGDELKVLISYDTVRFESDTIGRMLGHLQTIFSAIVENPQQKVSELPLLSARERHQLLVEWNETAREYPRDKCIHQLFESQVEKTPDAVAVVFENQQLTYQQLNHRANQLAHHLLSLGVEPEVLVGICVERSIEMVVGLLGILKAGGAYVPLDPTYPQERLSYMLADSGVEVLLTQQKLLSSLPSHTAQVVCLDSNWGAIEQHSQENLDLGVCSNNLAYVIYTSGSTGKPKGVEIEHLSLCNLAQTQRNLFDVEPTSRILQFASVSFDASVSEIFIAVTSGAMLVLGTASKLMPGDDLKQILQHYHVTHVTLPPSALAVLPIDELPGLAQIIVAGEACSIELANQWSVGRRFFNAYGPTESTVCATVAQISDASERMTIGRPIANTLVYILNKHLQPVPIGVTGELYIGGDGLARGYLNRPELTSEKFIPNPFSDDKSERLYKTGDLARYLSDGNIEYIGRIDQQVKIRGFRIELGEIEAVLNSHAQIQQTVVIATEDLTGNKRLVAYVVSEDESLSTHQLREFLKSKLPEYMVPSAFVTLDTLPLTPNGKVDRKALPAPDGEISREQEYVAPRTAIEQVLTNIWQELLQKEQVSIHDNFFEIGGDSILSIQMVSRAKNSGVQITAKQIFQNQTIAELAKVANTTVSVTAQQGIVTGVAPLTPIQQWFFAQNRQEAHHYNQSVLLQIPNHLQTELIETAWKKLLEHHDALRLRFSSVASEHKQINQGFDDTVAFTVVDLSSTPVLEQPQNLLQIATEFQASLNLSDGPLMQVVMFNLGSYRDARLLIIIHHLAVDGVSWRILLSDLETIYQQLITTQPIKLSAKTTAFIDWAEKINNYAQTEIIKQELDYWLNQPWSKTTPLPLDYTGKSQENTVGSTAVVSVKLSIEETQALLGSVNEAYNTQINDILLSALVVSLTQWTGNSTVRIDLEGHGREELFSDVDLSRTVGWFTSLFPVLLQLPAINQPASVIKSIKEQLRAIPNRGIGYGILRYLCEDPIVTQKLQTISPPEICFNYLGQFDQVQSQTGWKFAPESTGANQSLKQTRDHLLEINSLVVEGELQINWTYSRNIHSSATVDNLAQSYLQAIRSIIEHCQLEDAFGYTPSDFPDAQLNQLELDDLLAPLKTQNISSIYPLSPMQQGMLFHSLYAPESGVYFEQMTLNFKGNVNVATFESTWQKVVDRHSILRTFFVWENRQTPLQVVLKRVNLPWDNLDWRGLSPTEQQQQLSELLQTQRRLGFQFNQAPLMRCALIKLSEDTYKFIWSHHHILMDGWCLPIILREVLSFYEAELRGETCQLPTPSPYRDYIAWLNDQDQETAIEFWQQTLQGFSAPTPLVVDKTQYQNQQQDSDYKELELRLSAQVSRQLQSVAQESHVTLSTIVQAAWGLLLSRYSGEQDVVFGVTVSGRTGSLSGVENLVGLLINTLPLRLQISPDQQLIPWLEQIQQLMWELQHYSYTPLVDIQARSEVPGGIPLFESILVFENYPVESSLLNQGGSLQLGEIEGFEQTNYPLTVVAVPGDELKVLISYDTVRFESDTIGRMLGHLQTIFSAIVENPQQKVSELPLLSARERHQLLVEWNETAREYPRDKCIHQLFESQVEKTPDAVAVVFENQQLTYQQLNHRANQLAHHLLSLGVEPEVLVGICVERSIEMVVGLLGILKAGGAYVPLDPNYPQERLSYMLADSGVEVLLTQQKLLSSLPSHTAQVVCLDSNWGAIEQHSQENLDLGVCSNNLAYVIYTSGSTGKPKGVEIEHLSLCNLAQTQRNLFDVEPTSRILQFASVSFDASVWEIFIAVTSGAMLVLGTASKLMPGDDLKQILQNYHVTHVLLPPSALAVLPIDELPGLAQIIVGGEACSIELANQWSVGRRFFNAYGPTESTVCATVARISDASERMTIGRPIANTLVYILNKHLQPVPIGVTGELYIGGDGLARGYLNRPELTSEKFIPNPFDPKSKLYKTGDLARYLPDGNVEYLGRIDNQVKIRGFRIELGEIEAVLNSHAQIQQTVVIATEDITGNKRLVAYVVSEDESLSTQQLREFLKSKLPEYMVPSAFVTLDTLPLTPNGKVDRKALPAPDGEISREQEYVAPRTPSEEIIANIFASVLGVQNVGIHDNFFSLGGHSLLATQLISRLRVAFEVEIELRAVFSSPTVAQLDQTLTQLRTSGSGLSLPPIQPRTNTEQLPLSFAQERLWFLNQLEGTSATYNIPGAIRVSGNLDINALEQALSEIVRRHEVLRTSFPTVNGTPIQVIHPEATMNIKVVDLQQLAATARETVLQQQVQQEAITPFDLEIAPLIRCSLLQLEAREYVLLLNMHHIVSDGWSIGVFISELSTLYRAFSKGELSPLPELAIQYADFAVWQRKWLRGAILETQINYWRKQLQGTPSLLQLPTDRSRPSIQTYKGNTQSFSLNAELSQKLQSLSRDSGTTLFMTLYAAFATLLYRYSGESDIVIGTPIANRNYNEIESLIGFFVNTLVLRTQFTDNPNFESLLGQVRETTLQAYEHQDVPFEQIVEALKPERSLSYSPLFQVMFVWQNAPMGKLELPGVMLNQIITESTIAKFDLTVSMSETEAGLVGSWEYNTDLFDRSTIERMTTHFENLLSAIVENPQQKVSELPLLSAAERHQLLVEWNDTATEYPSDKCIHQLFESQVEKTPDAVAVVFEDQQLTYQELNQRANQLAHYLKDLGVRPEVLVGICVKRSIDMVVGLLGILKAGGAYLPLDPDYLQQRVSFMLEDAQVKLLLAEQQLFKNLVGHEVSVISLDTDWEKISQEDKKNLPNRANLDNLAYVIFTSGSTGKAKGVAIGHKQLLNYMNGIQERILCKIGGNFALVSTFAADLGNTVIFSCLASGGCLHILSKERASDAHAFLEYCQKHPMDVLKIVPSHFSALLSCAQPANILPRQKLIFGGEATSWDLIKKIQGYIPNCQIFNHYGPTEATVGVLTYQIESQLGDHSQTVPLGLPLPNTQIYLLDYYLQPVPIGVSGELYIGGDGLARGYLNQPELTAEKFIQNPFSDDKSDRLYKTGDLVRYLADGNIEYLGRIDQQVKIRGFRIELGEIEAVLNSHDQIHQAVVIATEDLTGNKRLVAYVVSEDESLSTYQLREFLKSKLPEYMVPSAFVTLDTLPLTPNGKVDRKALPAPDGEISREQEYVAPRTPSEEIIANIIASVLGVQNVGIHDNFFSLGGHSLLATQLISRLRVAFEVEIELRAVFSSPTVAQLDQTLTQLRTSGSGLSLPPIQPRTTTEQLPLSFAQERLWFLNQLEGNSATYNMPTAIRITGSLDINALQQAFSEIVRRHEVLRTSFPTVNGTPIQVIHPEATMNIKVVDLQQLAATARETVLQQQVQLEAITPFDLEIAPLIRCSLLQLEAREYVLLLNMHHIVSDGWSIGVFISELSTLYRAFRAGVPSPLAELPIQYADFAVWQREWMSGEVLLSQINYWLSQLEGTPELLELPTDRTRPSVQSYRGATQSWSLNSDLTQKLETLSRNSGTTLFMTLEAAFSTLLYRYSGQSDILVGTPIANRNRSEIESLIGFFVNTLVLRNRFEDHLSFEQLLTQVRETTLEAYEHQDVPFEQVVEALQPQRSLSHSPLFQVMFVWQNAPMGELELPGITLSELNQESTIAKFDLTLSMTETDQGLLGLWEYNTDLFDGSTIERMAAHFENLLSAIVENPQQKVSELPLLSAAERHQLLVEWNDTAREYPQDKCIHQLFESQVEKTPDAVAVVFENQQLTYQQLNHRANQLAHHLLSLGVEPEVLVGICAERSIEMVVGLLGILKAGGAYVPLDPNYPQERLSYMLVDSQLPILLTQKQLLEKLPQHQAQTICLDEDWQSSADYSNHNPDSEVNSDNLAYIIYTSGSTGKPKGTMILHRGLVNYLSWCTTAYPVATGVGSTVNSSIAFDATITSIFSPLLAGRQVVLLPEEGEMEALKAALSNGNKLSLIKITPAHLEILSHLFTDEPVNIQTQAFIIGGEALSEKVTSFWQKHAAATRLINEYGPTETVVGCCIYEVGTQNLPGVYLPIGRPISNTELYILDNKLQPVPIGITGELHIGGAGLARGYLNRPELTSEKFIPNPFSDDKSERLYKTGDLARYLADGNIEYLGRIDNQVKIRGFRIELGEIEAVLNSHAQIQQTVVIATEDLTGNKRLVAYVVSENESLSTHQLREFLKSKLPEYMVPSAFVTLDTLPLTPNGKVDRKALPAPDGEISREHEYVAPRTAIELQLTQIWSSILGIAPVGVRDNFFELGGHSLLAVRLMSQIQQHFQINLPLATLFQNPTIEQLVHLLHSSPDSLPWSTLVPIKSHGNKPPLFCIHPVGGNVLCYQDLASYLTLEQPFYGLQSVGLNPQNQPHTSIEQMATHYIQELQTVQPHGPYFLSGWSFGGLVAFEMAQQLSYQGEQIALLALIDTHPISQEPEDDAALLVALLREDLDICLEQLRQFGLDEQLNYVIKQAKQKNLVPEDFDLAQARHLLKIYKLNIQASQIYQPQYYSGSVVLFKASETDADLEFTWNELIEYLETYVVPGNHQNMLGSTHVKVLAEKLQKSLEQAQTNQLEK